MRRNAGIQWIYATIVHVKGFGQLYELYKMSILDNMQSYTSIFIEIPGLYACLFTQMNEIALNFSNPEM